MLKNHPANPSSIKPQNLPETLVWYCLVGTYFLYFLGAQSIVIPLLGAFLVAYFVFQWWHQSEETPDEEKLTLSLTVWASIVAMLVIEVALIMGHLNFNLGMGQIVRSSINTWFRQWSLLALFPIAGHLKIRPELIYRGVCIVCLQSLVFLAIAYVAATLHLSPTLYTSPLQVVGGGYEYDVVLYGFDEDDTSIRLQLFTPWPPALGLMGNIYFWLSCRERDKKWRWIGMLTSVAMIITSVSRLALLCLPFVFIAVWGLTNMFKPWIQFLVASVCLGLGIFAADLIELLETAKNQLYKARASSSRVREVLGRMAVRRFWHEAPIWGHGITPSRGPKVVEHMPIGTHHTWYGLLFAHGIVGGVALAIALIWTFIDLLIKAQNSELAKVGLSIVLVLLVFTIGENINVLTHLYWPASIVLGCGLKEKYKF